MYSLLYKYNNLYKLLIANSANDDFVCKLILFVRLLNKVYIPP